MQRTFWSSLNRGLRAAAIWAALVAAQAAQADQTPVLPCATITPAAGQSAPVQDSWPIVLRNAFDEDGNAHPHLSLTVLIPVTRGDAVPCLADYLVEDLRLSADGQITGAIVPTNRDYPVFFYDRVVVDPAMILDWRFTPAGAKLAFGGYRIRTLLNDPTDAELAGHGLQPSALPPGWG